jgi:DNA-binding NtrC family response regulator
MQASDAAPGTKGALERILLVDDAPANLSVLSAALEPSGFEILAAANGAAAIKVASRALPDLILLDILMPEMDGLETCRRLKQSPATRDIPVIFLTARNETSSVVEAFRAGGVDYIVKPFQTEEVLSRVATHLRLSRLTRELHEKNRTLEARTAELTAEISRRKEAETARERADERMDMISGLEAERWNVSGMIGGSQHIRKITEDIRRLHQFSNTSVLIMGESGTGKELVARAIHFDSARANGPFIPVNCVAVPAELTESMFFGHIKGAFTGATADRKGYFEMAHGGTLFLDEIGDMPAALQAKLLRVLEDGAVTSVGSSIPRHVDVRVVAATNANLDARIASGAFRQDLYFRLARYLVTTPPLRERLGDVPLLAEHFLRVFAAEMGRKPPALTDGALRALGQHDFPGNIRELKNIMERALIESGGAAIESNHLRLPVLKGPPQIFADKSAKSSVASSLPLNLAQAEDLLIQRALQESGGNIADAARLLGVHRTRIYRKLAQEQPADTSE